MSKLTGTTGLLILFVLIILGGYSLRAYSVQTDEQVLQTKPIKLLFVGDMMFDRSVRFTINKHAGPEKDLQKGFDYIFGTAPELFNQYDLVVGNLEGPVTDFKSKTTSPSGRPISGFSFTFPIETAPALKKVGIDVVSLANNHTQNFGQAGLDQTRTRLTNAEVRYFGSPENSRDVGTTTCVSIAPRTSVASNTNVCVGLVGWHEFSKKNDQAVFDAIDKLRLDPLVQYIAVMPHWGVEYKDKPTANMRQLAKAWIDAGADAVIGAHPHVPQSVELYKNKAIFYSLGNFMFDQYFSFDTTHGIGVEVELVPTKTITSTAARTGSSTVYMYTPKYKVLPFENIGQRFSLPASTTAQKILDRIRTISKDKNGVLPPAEILAI